MKHSFIDKYSELNSLIHRLDPRTKIILLLLFVFVVVLTPPRQVFQFFGFFTVILAVVLLSKIPFTYVIMRSLVIIPFVLMVSVCVPLFERGVSKGMGGLSGLWIVGGLSAKSWVAAVSMIVLSSTTRFDALLKGLEKLGVPSLFIMLLSFMYRYVFVLTDEAMRMQRARDSRYCGVAPKGRIKVLANIIGTLFIRTYERGEQVYKSMAGRGFDGEIKTLNLMEYSMRDVVFSGIFAGSVIVIKIWIRG